MKTNSFFLALIMLCGISVKMNGQSQLQGLLGELNAVIDETNPTCQEKYSGLWFFCEDTFLEDFSAVKKAIEAECGTSNGIRFQISYLNTEYCGISGGRQR
jgi:hypothetical protein